jgi:hypothetical protein
VLELEAAGLAEPLLDSLLQGRSSLAKSLRRSASPVDEAGAGCDMAKPSRSDDEQMLSINENVRLLLEDGAQLLARLEDAGLSEELLETLLKGRSSLAQRLVMEAIKTSLPEAARGTPPETDHKAQPDQVQPGDEPKKEEIAQQQTDARAVHPKEDTKERQKRAEITQKQTDAKGVHVMVHEVVHAKEHIKEHLDMAHEEPAHSESAPDAEKYETPKHSGRTVQAQEHPNEHPKERTRDQSQVVQAEVEAGASPSQIAGTLPSATYSSSTQCKYSIVALYSTYTTELTLQNAGTLLSATSAAAPAAAAASEREREREREVEGREEGARAPPPKEHPKEHPKVEQNERAAAIVAVPTPLPASVPEFQPARGVREAGSMEEAVSAAERVEDAGARPTNTSQHPKEHPKEHLTEGVKDTQARPTNVLQQPQEVGEALAPQSVHPKEHPHQQPKEHQEVWGQELWVELRYAEGARTFGLREEQRLADVIALVGGVRPQSVRVLVADTRVCNADLCDLLAVRYAQEST